MPYPGRTLKYRPLRICLEKNLYFGLFYSETVSKELKNFMRKSSYR